MYNDTIKVANKIITNDDLSNIFLKIWENQESLKKAFKQEELANCGLETNMQNWTLKDLNSTLNFQVDFYDDTTVKFDDFHNFMAIFNNRLREIKNIDVRYNCYYSSMKNGNWGDTIYQSISIDIFEYKMDINVNLNSNDKKLYDIYAFIKNIIVNAPIKFDLTIQKKRLIINKIAFIKGLIPAIILALLLLLNPIFYELYLKTYIMYPMTCLLFGYILGSMFFSNKITMLYSKLIRDKKYVKYDINSKKEIYEDDVEAFKSKAEILIGNNSDNLHYRNEILDIQNKFKNYLPYELLMILIFSLVIILMNFL